MEPVMIRRRDFQKLIDALMEKGYRVVGPTVRDGAIVYDEVSSVSDLPEGWTDEQDAGVYRLARRGDAALFGYVVGPHSWKRFLFPPERRLWRAEREGDGFRVLPEERAAPRYAFLGVRACEIAAIEVQDRVFLGETFTDPDYRARRDGAFIIAVQCGQAGGTCFCVSMGTGPEARSGFDLALTEIIDGEDGGGHRFVVQSGTPRGAEIVELLPHVPAPADDLERARRIVSETASRMGRRMETEGLPGLLGRSHENPRWEEIAGRCLTCANCTLVCPTCFCANVEDTTDLTGDHAERWRRWDSCFTMEFSYIHGGSVRSSAASRYRQWMTHKLATWHEQFGTSGCVGCGRCITWCPVGIDITEEARVFRETEAKE